jgi:predicted alpha/beta superfamily hydrolase
MKKTLSFLVFLLLAVISQAQSSKDIVIGKLDSIQSKTLNEKRKIWVHVPAGASSGQRYPVVYLLDGDAHFTSVVGMIEQLSTVNGNSICPEMIVVAIPNTDRTRDLTPTHAGVSGYVDSNFVRTSGGGEKFLAFIEKELMPHIDSLYPTAPYKMLIGHSLGGLIVIHTTLLDIFKNTVFSSFQCL